MQGKNLRRVRERVEGDADRYVDSVRAFLATSAAEHGLSTTDLAAITGLSLNTVKTALRNGSRPTARTLAMIGAAIGMDLKTLDGGIHVRAASAED